MTQRERVLLSLLLPEKRTDRHNVYCLQAKRQEREARARLYPARARVDASPVNPPEPPAAA